MSLTPRNHSSPPPPKPKKTAILLAQRIVGDMGDAGLGPGTSLPSEKLMLDEYRVGRGTLREALRFLELQGVIRIKPGPGGGPVVTQPDSRHLASTISLLLQVHQTPFRVIVEVRSVLEPRMAAMAAEKGSDESRAAIDDAVAAMESSLGDEKKFLEENSRFHELIAWSSGNDLFGLLVSSLHWITDGTVIGVTYPPERRAAVLKAHRAIADAVRSGDSDAAYDAMSRHVGEFQKYMERKYPTLMDSPIDWSQFAII